MVLCLSDLDGTRTLRFPRIFRKKKPSIRRAAAGLHPRGSRDPIASFDFAFFPRA
jgi:hypothetical protein